MSANPPAYPGYEAVEDRDFLDQRLPTHWRKLALKRLLQFGNGRDHKNVEVDDGGYPVYGSGGPFARASEYLHDGETVLFGRKGTVDRPLYLNCRFWTVDTMYFTRINTGVCARYIYYAALDVPYGLYSTNTALPSMTQEVLGNHKIAVPPLQEQTQIAKFLDYETAKIDALIEKQQQLIALLKEKRQAVISHAVTKGLNPDAPMRDSGVEWLEEVPEQWVTICVRNMLRSGALVTQDGNHGELHPVASEYVDDGIPFLMASNVRNGTVSLEPCNFLSKDRADRLRIGFAKPGDLLLTHKGTVGEVALVPEEIESDYWMLTPQVTYYRWRDARYFNRFYFYYFQSAAFLDQLRCIGEKQSTRSYVGLVAQKDLDLLAPSRVEQEKIVHYLDARIGRYDSLVRTAEQMTQALEERRAALISAAVTGKIDVRDWKAPDPEPEAEIA